MKKILCLLASTFILSSTANAQLACGTDVLYNKLKAEHPEINKLELELGIAIEAAIAREKKSPTGVLSKTTGTVYDVPLVIHIVHDYGTEYLSDDAIFDAVEFWDKVYNLKNTDTGDVIAPFKKYIGNAEIRLRLATKDPSGNPTKGITRRHSYMTFRGADEAKVDYWPSNKYINVWFVNKFDASHSGAAAYAYYPSSAAFFPQFDGVISVASYYNTDKTIPHEIGHVLNLAHTWGNTNNPEVACGDDGVDDTPPTKGHASCSVAALYDTNCSKGYTKGSIDYPDTNNTQNIMEYAYCSKMFTIGQTVRMRAALTSGVAGRNNLYTTSNLTATGALLPRPDLKPIADFSIEKGVLSWGGGTAEKTYFLCQNSTTQFRFINRSWNDTITAVNWTFSNSPNLASSTLLTGQVINGFKDAGWATVTLEATGNNTGTTTINRQAVYVASTNAYSGGYNQFFQKPSDFADWPMFNIYNNNFKWEHSTTNGINDYGGCLKYNSFDKRTTPESYTQPQDGDYDDIYTPAFDFTTFGTSSGLNLNFFSSGSATNKTQFRDSMQIFASTNCGDSWVRITKLDYNAIINAPLQNAEFAPTKNSDWKAQTIAVPAALRTSKTFFRFRYWPSIGGNNFYMDNFSISPWTTEIKEIANSRTEIKLVPNPTSGATKLCFTSSSNGEATYVVRDVTGKVIYQNNLKTQPNVFVQQELDKSIFPSSGIYLITLTQSNQSVTNKLVVQ